jgi:hypothetical protein
MGRVIIEDTFLYLRTKVSTSESPRGLFRSSILTNQWNVCSSHELVINKLVAIKRYLLGNCDDSNNHGCLHVIYQAIRYVRDFRDMRNRVQATCRFYLKQFLAISGLS